MNPSPSRRFATRAASSLLAVLFALSALVISPRPLTAAESLSVTALHPIIGDLARQVGGDRVAVHDLLPLGGDPHSFTPAATDLIKLSKADLVLASGKKLEVYLDKVRTSTKAEIIEVGRRIPSITVNAKDPLFLCCPAHAHGSLDPHWWHNPRNMERAARIVQDAFTKADPGGAAVYRERAKAYGKRMQTLDKWVKKQVSAIPRRERKLVTAHLAFGYFAKEYGFQCVGLQGLTRVQEPSVRDLAATVDVVRKERLQVAFPERLANPKLLESLARETGLRLGRPLIADNMSTSVHDYESMIRANVSSIVDAFKQK